MGVGLVYPDSSIALRITGFNPRSAKVVVGVEGVAVSAAAISIDKLIPYK
jgi:hypothetical protein